MYVIYITYNDTYIYMCTQTYTYGYCKDRKLPKRIMAIVFAFGIPPRLDPTAEDTTYFGYRM